MSPKTRRIQDNDPLSVEQVIHIAAFRSKLRAFLRRSEQTARRWHLTPQRFQLLLTVKGAPDRSGRLSMTEIADRLSLSVNTITELCARAEQAGLLCRSEAEADRRLVYLEVTAEGERRLYGALREMNLDRGEVAEAFEELTESFRRATP
jgi:DNA-binding MarR family transcriptional regulator